MCIKYFYKCKNNPYFDKIKIENHVFLITATFLHVITYYSCVFKEVAIRFRILKYTGNEIPHKFLYLLNIYNFIIGLAGNGRFIGC